MNYSTLVCLCALLLSCTKSTGRERDAQVDAPQNDVGTPFSDVGEPDVAIDSGPRVPAEMVDLLFVVDNSGSTAQEQSSLAAEMPNLIQALASGDSEGRIFPPVSDLRVGFITSDMGTGGFTIPTCNEPNFGDDGILTRGTACGASPADAPYFGLRPASGDDVAAFGDTMACLTQVGTQGCGFEQQLDSMLKAITPRDGTFLSGEPITFVNGSRGHGDGANENFLRDESLLVVVMLTDEDDCSASNPDLFNRASATFTDPDLNLRCSRYADQAVHPVSRYVDGLLALHPPERLIFFAITGIPVDLAPALGERTNWEALVGDESVRDPRMIERPDPASPSQLTPVCSVPGRGVAFPAVRIVRVAEALERRGADVGVQSICQSDYGPVVDLIINHL